MTRLLALMLSAPIALQALPTMVRLGYGNCLSCHVAPQGGGILNSYGRGIDTAQSWRGGEYEAGKIALLNTLSFGGRLDQDFRGVFSSQLNHATGGPYLGVNRSRFFYRNVTQLGKGFRFSAVIDGETDPVTRKAKPYEPSIRPGLVAVTSAMLQFRPRDGLEIAAGRDALPTGLNIPDQTTFLKTRNRFGYYDTPTQVKAFVWKKRWLASPFAFAPSGREPLQIREKGGGLLAEYDLLGKGKTIVGVNGLHGSDRIGNRNLAGLYARLGFGKWGAFAEHDYTLRQLHASAGSARFGQNVSYGQLFYYPREWMAISAIAERLNVQRPYLETLMAYKGELSMRLSSNWTIGLRGGMQRDQRTGGLTPIASIQLAAKTVN